MLKNLKNLVRGKFAKGIFRIMFRLVSFIPKKRNLFIFESFHGRQFSDNPRAIYEYILNNIEGARLIWSVDRRHTKVFKDLNIPYIVRFTPKWFWLMPRAKYWINNVRLPLWIPKHRNTIYVQTWHGTPLKKLGNDIPEVKMPGTNTESYKNNFMKEANQWDYLVSPNDYSTKIFKRAFGYNGVIMETGYPRNDFLYNFSQVEVINIKKSLNIPKGKKVILYAPTWRDNQYYSVGRYKFDIQLNLDEMQKALGDQYVILLRLHYLIADNIDLSGFKGFAYNVSTYTDIRELYVISDLLITDYSSVFFDYANLKRPIIFYVYDLEVYRDELRGFYFNIEEESPGPLTRSTSDTIAAIKKIERDNFMVNNKFDEFYKKFCNLEDGSASKRVVNNFLINR